MIDNKATGKRIKQLMQVNNITVAQLAKMLYVTPSAVQKWLKGIQMPEISRLMDMTRIFNAKVEDIIIEE